MELGDSDFIDLVEAAYIAFDGQGSGTFVFGAVTGGLDCDYAPTTIFFTWRGHDEMDEASGSGSAKLNDDRTLTGEISFHLDDGSAFKTHRW